MIYYISDLHLNHLKSIERWVRPFNSIGEMTKTIMRNWNELVKEDDYVYCLGDFGYSESKEDRRYLFEIAERLNGNKILIYMEIMILVLLV